MFIIGYFLLALATVLEYLFLIILILVGARAVLSWVSPDPYNPIVRFIYTTTEPVLRQVRKWVPVFFGGIDFSPVVVFMVIMFLRIFLVNSLLVLSQRLIH